MPIAAHMANPCAHRGANTPIAASMLIDAKIYDHVQNCFWSEDFEEFSDREMDNLITDNLYYDSSDFQYENDSMPEDQYFAIELEAETETHVTEPDNFNFNALSYEDQQNYEADIAQRNWSRLAREW